jgi:hypothetical protein
VDRPFYSKPAAGEIPDHLDVPPLITADGHGHEALLCHLAQGGLFFCGVVVLTVVDRGNLGM